MSDADELRAKAEHALRLAGTVADDTASANLQKFAVELLEQARMLEAAARQPPPAESQQQAAQQQQQQPQAPDKNEE